mmetsp:Transcript_95434/g.309261  ORF Transcript_95434/g.309261 Transcript_95434/m.309261 type:complete len:121 (-) Transcript_95434:17-379(-)
MLWTSNAARLCYLVGRQGWCQQVPFCEACKEHLTVRMVLGSLLDRFCGIACSSLFSHVGGLLAPSLFCAPLLDVASRCLNCERGSMYSSLRHLLTAGSMFAVGLQLADCDGGMSVRMICE